MATQQLIDDLIVEIKTAIDANSVNNIMVATIFEYLNTINKTHGADTTAINARIDALLGRNASSAIDNFNEILKFLNGVTDNDSFVALLDGLKSSIRIATQIGSTAQTLATAANDVATQAKSDGEAALLQCSTLAKNKSDKWMPLLNDIYFNPANYSWLRVSLIADNGYYASGYQETETIDIDIQLLIEQHLSVGIQVYTITRFVGANTDAGDSSGWKAVRFNIIMGVDVMSIRLNTPSGATFKINTYLMK